MALHDVVEEGQSPTLSAERAVADTGEVGILVELAAVEDGHDTDVLHAAVLDDGVEYNLAVGVDILQLVPGDVAEELRHGEDGAGAEPAAHMVARHMVEHGVVGYVEDIVLELLEAAHTHHLMLGDRITEDEVAEPHVLGQQIAQVDIHLLRVLVDIMETLGLGARAVLHLAALHDEGHILVAAAYLAEQAEAGLGVFLALPGEAHVADHTDGVVGILIVDADGLLVGARKHHLGTSALALRRGVRIEGLGRETLALHKDIAVKIGQYGRVEAYAVLHQQYHLHAGLLDVVLDVHLVFEQLDDGEDEVGVAEPTEHIVEDGHVLILYAAGDAVGERCEHHAGQMRERHLYLACHGESVVVGIAGHADHQVDIGGAEHMVGILDGAHLGEGGRIAQAELHILVKNLLVDPAVVLEHEGIVGVGHDKHIEDTVRHEIDERHVLEVELGPFLRYIFHI